MHARTGHCPSMHWVQGRETPLSVHHYQHHMITFSLESNQNTELILLAIIDPI